MWKKITNAEFIKTAKVGMRVRIVDSRHEGRITQVYNGLITRVYNDRFYVGSLCYAFGWNDKIQVYIDDQPRTLDDLEEGDVLDDGRFLSIVLYVIKVKNGNHIVFLGHMREGIIEANFYNTVQELKRRGYVLKQPEPTTPQAKEVTMAELNAERESEGKTPVKIKE